MDPFQLAAKQLGMNERDQNAALQDYLTTGGVNLDPAVTAWCAAYVNATLAQAGMEGTGSNMARSFLDWGQEVQQPQKGDLAVFSRGDPNGPFGHVGFFDGYNEDGTIRVLGGNQGSAGEVSIANYSPDRLLGFRRADGVPVDATGQPVDVAATGPAGAPQNALAPQPEPPKPQIAMMDPSQFMTSQPNALAFQPFQTQRVNYLSGRG
jgi:uncharacterized protein (TIGR02594 family)